MEIMFTGYSLHYTISKAIDVGGTCVGYLDRLFAKSPSLRLI